VLIFPVWCSNNAICRVSPNQQTDTGTVMEASFGMVSMREDFQGALLYKLKRKHTTMTSNQSNNSIAFIEDTATNVYLLVAWDVTDERGDFPVHLLKCTDDFAWDEDKLWALRRRYMFEFCNLKTYGSDYKLDIVISEGNMKCNMDEPMELDPKRLVLSLSMLIVLMYTISLPIKPSFKLNIYNQCLNVGLAFPTYITGNGLECHRPPNHKVYAEDIMRSGFIIELDCESFGLLMYKVQRQSHKSTETGEDTSNDVHLLVVWRISESKELHADVLLVEYAKEFTWNEDKLKKLYYENHDRLKESNSTASDIWFVDDNMTLKTIFDAKDLKENIVLSIFIFEEKKSNYAMRPFCIDFTK
jgi:hypothetical protein